MRVLVIATTLAGLALAVPAAAQVPTSVPMQGTLYEATTGDPFDGTLPVTFSLYGDPAGMALLWQDTVSVPFVGGIFTVYLGAGDPIDPLLFAGNPQVFVGIAVDGEAEMDLIALATAPYAAMSAFAAEAGRLDGFAAADLVAAAVDAARSVFATQSHRHGWSDLDGIPAGFADGVDDVLTEAAVDVFAGNNGYLTSGSAVSWAHLTGVPAGFADGVDDDTSVSEATVDGFVANNGYLTSGSAVPWSSLSGVPAGFADGADNDTTLSESQVDAYAGNNGYATSGRGVEPYNCARYPSSGWLNNMDAVLSAQCPAGQVLNGLHSYHDNGTEDRQWAYYCCALRLQ